MKLYNRIKDYAKIKKSSYRLFSRNNAVMLIYALAGLLDSIITICSFGMIFSDFRAEAIFNDKLSDWGDKDNEK